MEKLNLIFTKLHAKAIEKNGDGATDKLIGIVIAVALAVVVITVLSSSIEDISVAVVNKLKGLVA